MALPHSAHLTHPLAECMHEGILCMWYLSFWVIRVRVTQGRPETLQFCPLGPGFSFPLCLTKYAAYCTIDCTWLSFFFPPEWTSHHLSIPKIKVSWLTILYSLSWTVKLQSNNSKAYCTFSNKDHNFTSVYRGNQSTSAFLLSKNII